MNKKIKKIIFCFLFTITLLILLTSFASSQTLPQLPWVITSDFGPRMFPHWDFHKGIDYGAGEGSFIASVETGSVNEIDYSGGWYIRIKGNRGYFTYLHIFNDSQIYPNDSPFVRRSGLLDLRKTKNNNYCIVFWNDANRNLANKALCVIAGEQINNDVGNVVKMSNGETLLTRSNVETEVIAPSGVSGNVPPHLHLGFRPNLIVPRDNPLYHVQHPPDELPRIAIKNPPNNYCFPQEDSNTLYPFRVYVDSHGCSDLDKVTFTIYVNNNPNSAVFLETFRYGGDINTKKNSVCKSNGLITGVQPGINAITGEGQVGEDTFILLTKLSNYSLPPGRHSFVVTASDVNGNLCMPDTHYFTIGSDTVPPVVSNIHFSPNPTNSGSVFTATIADSLSNIVQAC